MNQLPEELKNLPPIQSTQECFDLLMINKDEADLSKEERYQLYQAKQYFKENMASFPPEEIVPLLKTQAIKKYFSNKINKEVLDLYIKHGEPLPKLSSICFSSSLSYKTKHQYLEIINSHDVREQLEVFLNVEPHIVKSFYHEPSIEPSSVLTELLLQQFPEEIFQTRGWNERKIKQWLDNNSHLLMYIALISPNIDWSKVSTEIKESFYEKLVNTWDKKIEQKCTSRHKTIQNILDCPTTSMEQAMIRLPIDFLYYFNEKHPDMLLNIFSSKKTINSSSPKNNITHLCLNELQSLLMVKSLADIDSWKPVIEKFIDIVKQPIETERNLYLQTNDVFTFCQEQNERNLLVAMSCILDKLEKKEQEMIVSSFFSLCAFESGIVEKFKDNSPHMQWCRNIMTLAPLEMLDYYYAKSLPHMSQAMLQVIEPYKFARELEDKLDVNQAMPPRRKI